MSILTTTLTALRGNRRARAANDVESLAKAIAHGAPMEPEKVEPMLDRAGETAEFFEQRIAVHRKRSHARHVLANEPTVIAAAVSAEAAAVARLKKANSEVADAATAADGAARNQQDARRRYGEADSYLLETAPPELREE